ncbi:MAG TPA: YARHG domain-containing protein [Pyrinomonadaceae bacterium]|nr:YARHG domain-containing protein [Pyrinomonadaceae bacterium]
MKQCPTCHRTYTDDALVYCLDDGSVLAAVYDPQATQIIAPPRRTDPMPTAVFIPPTQPAQQPPPPSFAPVQPQPVPPRQGVNPAVVYVLVALLALLVGGGVVALLLRPGTKDETSSSTSTPKTDPSTTASREPATKEQQALPTTGNLSTPTPSNTPRPQPSPAAPPTQAGVPGNYPEASTRNLNEGELAAKSCYELKIMRNEIYARHGYIFKTDDMRAYFSRQSWYRPLAADVSGQLSGVERRNTQLIKQYESGKGCS